MFKHVGLFIGLAIIIGLGVVIVSAAYDSVALPGGATVSTPANPVPEPDDIPGLIAWYDADDSATISIGVGVAQWDDKSGQGNHMVQGTGSAQPVVTSGDVNGRDVISFDGVNDFLHVAALATGNEAQPATYVMVLKPDADTSAAHYYADGDFSSSTRLIMRQLATSGYYDMHAGSALSSSVAADSSDYTVLTAVFDTTSSVLYHEGTSIASGNAGTRETQGVTLASTYNAGDFTDMDIGLFLIYDDALTAGELDDIHDYVETEFNLGMTLNDTYGPGTTATEGSGWSDVQTNLFSNSQASFGILALVLIAIAALVVLLIVRRMN